MALHHQVDCGCLQCQARDHDICDIHVAYGEPLPSVLDIDYDPTLGWSPWDNFEVIDEYPEDDYEEQWWLDYLDERCGGIVFKPVDFDPAQYMVTNIFVGFTLGSLF